jgi:hypothetical protein
LGAAPIVVGDGLIEPSHVQVLVILFDRERSFPELRRLVPQGQILQGMLELVDGFGLGNGRCSLAQVEDFMFSAIMLSFVWLTDQSEGLHSLVLHGQ